MQSSGTHDDLEAHRRMRACLEGIRHLDQKGVATRIADVDREIAALEAASGSPPLPRQVEPPAIRSPIVRRAMEFVSIGPRLVRAA